MSLLRNFKIIDETETHIAEVDSNKRLKIAVDSEGWDDTNKVEIWDGTETAQINTDGRLLVESTINAIPATAVEYSGFALVNSGGSSDMAVNGSSTPQEFTFTPPASEVWYVERLTWMFNDNGSADPGDFAAIAGGLTNGVEIEVRSNGNTSTQGLIKTNIEVAQMFTEAAWTPTSGFMGGENVYMGSVIFRNSFRLSNSTSDYIKFTIQDDLSGLDFFKVTVLAWREQ